MGGANVAKRGRLEGLEVNCEVCSHVFLLTIDARCPPNGSFACDVCYQLRQDATQREARQSHFEAMRLQAQQSNLHNAEGANASPHGQLSTTPALKRPQHVDQVCLKCIACCQRWERISLCLETVPLIAQTCANTRHSRNCSKIRLLMIALASTFKRELSRQSSHPIHSPL